MLRLGHRPPSPLVARRRYLAALARIHRRRARPPGPPPAPRKLAR